MTSHPIFPEQLEDEEWTDWYLRSLDTVTANPPDAPEGFVLIPCEATPRHLPTYMLDDGETNLHGCPQCAYADLYDSHRVCEHKQHCAWRHWKASKKVASKLYAFGLLRGYGTTHSKDCPGCLVSIHWSPFRGPYVLFVKRETWRCWRAGHRRGDEVGFGYCGKCIPWYCCGSTGHEHADGCDAATS